jgi:hypothetical protein
MMMKESRIWTLALAGALMTSACNRNQSAAPEGREGAPVRTTVDPWEPVDKSFRGCAGG